MDFLLRGDFRYFWPENIGNFAHLPYAWDNILNTGIGQPQMGTLWITSYLNLTSYASKLGISWEWIQLLFWILPAVIISFLSSYLLFNYLLKNKYYSFLSGFVYSFNTYFLMVLTGGQLGVSLSYSLAPLVVLAFMRLIKTVTMKNSVLAGLALGFQLLFDPRIVFITLVIVFSYFLFNFSQNFKIIRSHLLFYAVPFVVCILLNSFWIMPILLTRSLAVSQGLGGVKDFIFFSFADFSHSLALIHPNWPENIFGKVYFLKPEFLILPIIAFASLFFSKNKNILFFSFLALIGAFLSKGANPPFGEINQWVFQNFPGMNILRDSTKWYLLIAMSYSILIPYALSNIKIKKFGNKNHLLIGMVFVFFWLFTIRDISLTLTKDSNFKEMSKDYVALKNLLDKDKKFSRTLWIPQWQRFGFFSNVHPAIGREEIFKGDAKNQIEELKKNKTEELLKDTSIKYVLVPFDLQSEIFLTDRKYDKEKYQSVAYEIGKIKWLNKVSGFDNLAVFEIKNPKGHFWSTSKDIKISDTFISPSEYEIKVADSKDSGLLVFSEKYDKNWIAQSSKVKISSIKYGNNLNSFLLPADGEYEIYYEPQGLVNLGLVISGLTLVSALVFLFGSKIKK